MTLLTWKLHLPNHPPPPRIYLYIERPAATTGLQPPPTSTRVYIYKVQLLRRVSYPRGGGKRAIAWAENSEKKDKNWEFRGTCLTSEKTAGPFRSDGFEIIEVIEPYASLAPCMGWPDLA